MKKKFICAVCGYIYEGDAAPEKCPICKAPASKFSEMEDNGEMTFATVHKIGDGKPEGVSQEMIDDLRNHFNGECGEVGMYLAMSRQADREGYPEIAEALLPSLLSCWVSAYGIPRRIWRSALLPRLVLARISSVSLRTQRWLASMRSTTLCMRWRRTRPVMVLVSLAC